MTSELLLMEMGSVLFSVVFSCYIVIVVIIIIFAKLFKTLDVQITCTRGRV